MSIAGSTTGRTYALPRQAHAVLDAWRAITSGQAGLAVLLGLAAVAPVLMKTLLQHDPVSEFIAEIIKTQISAFALLLAVVVADRAADQGAPKLLAYGAAVVIAATVGVACRFAYLHVVSDAFNNPADWLAPLVQENPYFIPTYAFSLILEWVILGGLATYVYVDRREAHRLASTLHAAQLARNAQAKRVLESQLQTMQARVEPQFLFSTLAQVKDLYERDAVAAERMLDDLIAYLRAAMPRMHDTSSTVAQEVELARAYLNIITVRLGDRLTFAIDMPGHLGQARLPPMMLLPLIDHAIARGVESQQRTIASLRIAIVAENGKIRLVVHGGGAALGTDSEAIIGIRERLYALFGGQARLDIRPRDDQTNEAVMEIPHESRRAAPRRELPRSAQREG